MELLNEVYKKLEQRIATLTESLSSGSLKDYAEYRDMCGVIRGLRTAQMEVEDLASRLKESEDE